MSTVSLPPALTVKVQSGGVRCVAGCSTIGAQVASTRVLVDDGTPAVRVHVRPAADSLVPRPPVNVVYAGERISSVVDSRSTTTLLYDVDGCLIGIEES